MAESQIRNSTRGAEPDSDLPAPRHTSELERLRVLYRISDLLATTQRSEDLLRLILREAVKAMRATSGSMILIDPATKLLNIRIGYNIDPRRAEKLKLKIGEGVTGHVAKSGKPLLVGDVRRSPHYVKIKADVKSELAVPLTIGGEVVGVINVDSNERDAFTDGDLELLVAIAAQSAKVMQAANLYEENLLKAERLSTLFKVASTLVTEPIVEDVLRRIADEVRELMGVRVCSIMLLDELGENLEIKAVSGEIDPAYINRRRIPVEHNVIGRVVRDARPLFVPDVRREKNYRLREVARASNLCALLSIPMVFLSKPIGVLNIYTDKPAVFSDDDVALIETFAGNAAVAIINARRYDRTFRAEELLRESEKLQLLGVLSAEIAHEIRNPLTSLRLLTHTMQDEPTLSWQGRYDLGVMERKLEHINQIVDQVLDFARSRQPAHALINLNEVIEDVLFLVSHKAAQLGRRVEKQTLRSLPPVLGDAGQLEQAILNIAINGLQALDSEDATLYVSTSAIKRKTGQWVRVRVRDEGSGIPEEELSNIFTPFFSRRDQGTGLGLFITRRIVTEHQGELKVKSKLSEGATFDILLPVATADDAKDSGSAPPVG